MHIFCVLRSSKIIRHVGMTFVLTSVSSVWKMDENKRDINKTKRSRSDHVKIALINYLQKRNYPFLQISNITTNELLMHSIVESESTRQNSILYSCYNSDPIIIDHTFTKFLMWLKDLIKKKMCHDLEFLVPPLFCHLYLDILKAGHSERAANFFKVHSPAVDKLKCDDLIKNLMISFANDNGNTYYREQFRGNKYCVSLSPMSVHFLKRFIAENCHVVFLQVLQSWFEIREVEEEWESEESMVVSIEREDSKFHELKNIINELKHEPKPLFCVNLYNTKEEINCAVIKRSCGIIAYSQQSSVRVRSIHPYDNIVCHKDSRELSFHGHSGKVYGIAISGKLEYLATASSDNNVCVFDLINAELINVCKGHLGPVYSVAISNPPSFVASGSFDTTARLWSTDKGQMLRVFIGHSLPITCVQFHPNNVYLATGSADRTLRLWNLESGKTERLFHVAKGTIFAVAFHPRGQFIASASDDKRIHIWDILNSRLITELKYKEDLVMKLSWSKDGKLLATGTITGVIRLWDFDTIQENSSGEVKFHEPCLTMRLHSKILDIEYSCDSFACISY